MSVESNGSRKAEIGINRLSDTQEEQLRSIGEKVLRVTRGLEAIESINQVISKEKNEILKYEEKPIRAELGSYFAITIKDPDVITMYGTRMIDNGCRSGVVFDKLEGVIKENNDEAQLPLMFFATSIIPRAQVYHYVDIIYGYEFLGPDGYSIDLDLDRQNRGKPLGVELGTVTFEKAYSLIGEGKVALPLPDKEHVDSYLRGIQYAMERDTSRTGNLESVAIVSEN